MDNIVKANIQPRHNIIQDRICKGKLDIYFLFGAFFIFSFLFFFLFGNYVFFYQENLSLFVFSGEYLQQFIVKPGGLLEYTGNFLKQGYFNNIYGSFILSSVFILIAIILLKINKRLFADRHYLVSLAVLPSCLLLLLQTNYNFLIHNNLGFLLVVLYFLFSVSSDKMSRLIFVIVFFPVFYYFAGAYAWIYFGMFILYSLFYKKVIVSVILFIIGLVSLFLFKEVFFLQPFRDLLVYPLALKDYFKPPVLLFTVYGFFIFYPLLIKVICQIKKDYGRIISIYSVLIIFSLTIFFQSRLYNPGVADLFKLEELVNKQDWDGVIIHQENTRSPSMIAQYYYNIALSEKGILCDKMFFGPQDFGTKSILIPWDSQAPVNNIFRGIYFYYTIGLINEAHRWAFESMVIQGYRPENIKLLIKTDLINGHFKVAEKYIYVLKRTLHYRSWAKKYEKMLYNPGLIKSDPELAEKMRLQPKKDFPIRIKNPQSNVILLLETNPCNKVAFEYKIAWFMLEKNVEQVVNEVKKMKGIGYSRIPRHIEEVILILQANKGWLPDLGGLKVSNETELQFFQYENNINPFNRIQSSGVAKNQKKYENTFWYYLNYKSRAY